jgi:hydrogenase nickel incorporation protein HypA/HybF
MHEFSIASEIWESVAKAAREHGGGRVLSISLEVGALNLLAEEQLRFWIGLLAERDGSPGVEVEISCVPARLRCRDCGAEGEASVPEGADHFLPPALLCPACGSPNVEVTGGRELRVMSARIEERQERPHHRDTGDTEG